jgi:hypothetical protein
MLSGRFEIEREIGRGGMAQVYRGIDRETNQPVAVKVMLDGRDAARFELEARTLSSLDDPGVVRYVAHGETEQGAPWLAMEWLDGEDLSVRLARGPLSLSETETFATRIATTLASLHARRFVHRDLKPSNIFLPGGDLSAAKLLDFGLARHDASTRITRTGMMIGTPAYMSPEQARAAPTVDARTDVFALGCVLHECLAGAPAFPGENAIAVLARILVDEAESLEEVRADVPRDLAGLVRKMLSKDPADRPPDGAAVLAALAAHEVPPASLPTTTALRVAAIVLGSVSSDESVDDAVLREARAIAAACNARLELMANGAVVAIFSGTGAAADLARAAATFALRSRALFGAKSFAVAMGRADLGHGRIPIGEVVDPAAALLERAGGAGSIQLDPSMASTLEPTFEIREGDRLGEPRSGAEAVRRVLGRATPCVGREREIRFC